MDELQDLVDEVSRLLDAPATLESPDFALIAFCAHDPQRSEHIDRVRMQSILGRGSTAQTRAWFEGFGIATARTPVRTPADPGTGVLARLCMPVRAHRALLGYLWLLDEGRIDLDTDPRLDAATTLVRRMARTILTRDHNAGELASDFRLALVGGRAERTVARRALARHLGTRSATVVVVHGATAASAATVGTDIDGARVLLVPLASPDDDRRATGAAMAARGTAAGVGAPTAEAGRLRECYRQAAYAARVAAVTGHPHALRWSELGPYQLLRDVRAPCPDHRIDALASVPTLLQTAEVFLDCAGSVQRTAAALHVHRQTLYHRLSRVEALTGLSLDRGEDRLLLHMSVKVFRLGGGAAR